MAACHFCKTLLEDLALILDKIQFIIRLLRLTIDMEPSEENPLWEIDERLDLLRHHLVDSTETYDYLISVLNVRCGICGNEF